MKKFTLSFPYFAARIGAIALSPLALCMLSLSAVQLASHAPAQAQQSTPDAATLMARGAALEAAGQWQKAGQAYTQASNAYTSGGKTQEALAASLKALAMSGKELDAVIAQQSPATAADVPAAAPETPMADSVVLPPSRSAIVHPGKNGSPTVTSASGASIDGVKLSKYDTNIQSPSLAVGSDGVIHAAFWEAHGVSQESAIYYRSSADGGKSWTAAKNLSDVMPNLTVGRCRIVVDGAGRVYVIWRVASVQYGATDISAHARNGGINNLMYRVLSGGQWNAQPIPIHQMADQANQLLGSASDFVSVDPAGTVHVVWVEDPAIVHPDVQSQPGQSSPDVGLGLVMEATLDGTTASAPRQVYEPPVTRGGPWPVSDGLDMINGYFDASGQAHFVAEVAPARGGQGSHFKVIENNSQTAGVDLPGLDSSYWDNPPTLLQDAQGRQHILTLYPGGDTPAIRDYTVGSDAEPKTIRAVKDLAGTLQGLEGFQGPRGEMIALLHMDDTGAKTDAELYVSTSQGGAWSTPVNVTNNAGRLAFHAAQTGTRTNTLTESWGSPGPAAATFDKSGHLLLLYVRNTTQVFSLNAFGVGLAGNDSATPTLLFLRF